VLTETAECPGLSDSVAVQCRAQYTGMIPQPAPERRASFPGAANVLYWVLSALSAYLCWMLMAPLLAALTMAFGLAIVVSPLHRRLERRIKSPALAAAPVIVILLIAIIAPGALLVSRTRPWTPWIRSGPWHRRANSISTCPGSRQ
jgi:hypothetical protein